MKTKLLRKIRKKYQIFWYPNGTQLSPIPHYKILGVESVFYSQEDLEVYVNQGKTLPRVQHQKPTQDEAYKLVLTLLTKYILHYYSDYGIRRNKKRKIFYKPEKVWYNE